MKKASFLLALAGMMTLVFAACVDEEINPEPDPSDSTAAGSIPEGFVDLGLPSGLLWAECNLGASTPEGYGDYYAWGETAPKSSYDWNNNRYCNGGYTQWTKYCTNSQFGYNGFTDGLTTLQAMDDAATQSLGNGARTPTKAEWEELLDNTTSTWTTENEVYGLKITAPNGNSLFLPAAGRRYINELYAAGTNANYWSSTLSDSDDGAWNFFFYEDNNGISVYDRASGLSVRPVYAIASVPTCTPTYGDTTASAAGGFTWRGRTYTATGDYTTTLTNAAGCDSILTLHLTILPPPATVGFDDDGASLATFSVASGRTVRFSRGNLQYLTQGNHLAADGQLIAGNWRFAEHQYDFVGQDYNYATHDYNGWCDLFGWGTSGWNSGAAAFEPWSTSQNDPDYGPGANSLTGDYAYADWGVYNAIQNGGNTPGAWRTLTIDEMQYLFGRRPGAANKYGIATIGGRYKGLVVLPDTWQRPDGLTFTAGCWGADGDDYSQNEYSYEQWAQMEAAGAVFLPAAGDRSGTTVYLDGGWGHYWSASKSEYFNGSAQPLRFKADYFDVGTGLSRLVGCSVRLVKD